MLNMTRIIGIICIVAAPLLADEPGYDIVVYGGTSGAVTAAVQAAKMGKRVIVVSPDKHLGGLSSGGLGATDIGNKAAIGGLSREFYHRVFKAYQDPGNWKQQKRDEYKIGEDQTQWMFEPHVAEAVFEGWIADSKIPVVRERLDLARGVTKKDSRIVSITTEAGHTYAGRVFIDATYEGDLMAKAGVKYAVGREANSVYRETLNGVQVKNAHSHQFAAGVDPYNKPGDAASGLLPGIHGGGPGEEGSGDGRVQAYNFRMCLTDVPENRVPYPKPADYDERRYELLIRYLATGSHEFMGSGKMMPNRKTDTNNTGAFSTDDIGMNYDYPDGDYATRAKIIAEHESYQKGLMWTVTNHPRIPAAVREKMSKWGLAKDEFVDNGNWPHQLYVREARRMVSDYVMTEHNCRWTAKVEDPVGMGAYNMDSHHTQRFINERGHAYNEGDVEVRVKGPYGVSYRSIVPRSEECTNLVVPICLSASHIAYGSIRMEPVFMVLGQSAATAASLAIDADTDVQKVEYAKLKAKLVGDGQILTWAGK